MEIKDSTLRCAQTALFVTMAYIAGSNGVVDYFSKANRRGLVILSIFGSALQFRPSNYTLHRRLQVAPLSRPGELFLDTAESMLVGSIAALGIAKILPTKAGVSLTIKGTARYFGIPLGISGLTVLPLIDEATRESYRRLKENPELWDQLDAQTQEKYVSAFMEKGLSPINSLHLKEDFSLDKIPIQWTTPVTIPKHYFQWYLFIINERNLPITKQFLPILKKYWEFKDLPPLHKTAFDSIITEEDLKDLLFRHPQEYYSKQSAAIQSKVKHLLTQKLPVDWGEISRDDLQVYGYYFKHNIVSFTTEDVFKFNQRCQNLGLDTAPLSSILAGVKLTYFWDWNRLADYEQFVKENSSYADVLERGKNHMPKN